VSVFFLNRLCICNRLHGVAFQTICKVHCTGLDRPLRLQEVEAPRIPRQPAHKDYKSVNPTHRLPFSSRRLIISLRGWVHSRALERPEGWNQEEIPIVSSGVESDKRYLSQHLNSRCVTDGVDVVSSFCIQQQRECSRSSQEISFHFFFFFLQSCALVVTV